MQMTIRQIKTAKKPRPDKMQGQTRYPRSLRDSVRPVATFLQTEAITSQESN